MIDLSKGPYALKMQSASVFLSALQAALPNQMEVTLKQVRLKKGGKTPALQVRDGLWRGATLVILDTNQQLALGGIQYRVPTFAAKAIVFLAVCASFSLIFTIFASIVLGQLAPVGMFGGLAGALISGTVENMIAKRLRDSSWSAELKNAIETVNV
jgi:hypothetical protein